MVQKINTFKPILNSFKKTFCVFHEKNMMEINELAVDFESESGSKYYYTELGMYRLSNHWGRLANSKWRLIESGLNLGSKYKLGFANWDDFYPDNDNESLYFLEVDWNQGTVLYQHKYSKSYDGKPILRTAHETTKRVKQARNILNLTQWAKYFKNADIESLRKIIVNELIYTNKSLETIKRERYEP